MKIQFKLAAAAFVLLSSVCAHAACDFTNENEPCTGRSITVTVPVSYTGSRSNSKPATFIWDFNSGGGDAYCGRFANGDYWIAPRPGAGSVQITSVTGNGIISVDADPVMEATGLLGNPYGN